MRRPAGFPFALPLGLALVTSASYADMTHVARKTE